MYVFFGIHYFYLEVIFIWVSARKLIVFLYKQLPRKLFLLGVYQSRKENCHSPDPRSPRPSLCSGYIVTSEGLLLVLVLLLISNVCSERGSGWNLKGTSVQFSRSVVSNSLRPHETQHARPPCPSPTPGVHPNPNPYPLSRWCHPTISSSVISSSCPQSLPASGSFQMSQLSASGGQSIGVSASTSVTQGWSPLGWTGWIALQSKGLSRVFSNTTVQKHQFFSPQLSL